MQFPRQETYAIMVQKTRIRRHIYVAYYITLHQFVQKLNYACLCLPLTGDKDGIILYTIICSSWKVLNEDEKFVLPKLNVHALL